MTTSSKPVISSQPWLHQKGEVIQEFGTVKQFPIGLSYEARMYSCQRLNRALADTQILFGLYKKHHWLMRGATFYQLHLVLDKHAAEQLELIDTIAERVQSLGVSPWAIPGMSRSSRRFRGPRTEWRRCRPCCHGCWRLTRPSSSTPTTPPPGPSSWVTTVRTTCWSHR